MPLQIIDCEQGTPEWKAVRCKKVTSSRFKDVMAQGQGKTRESYLWEKVEECITGQVKPHFVNDAMRWGTEHEAQARAIYLLESDALSVHVPGFCQLNEHVGASTDGLVDDDGMLEVKCPSMRVQHATVMKAKVPTEHIIQIQGGLWVNTPRQWCDFVSSCPLLKGEMSYFCVRVFRDEEKIKQIEAQVNMFVADLLGLLKRLNGHEPHRLYIS